MDRELTVTSPAPSRGGAFTRYSERPALAPARIGERGKRAFAEAARTEAVMDIVSPGTCA